MATLESASHTGRVVSTCCVCMKILMSSDGKHNRLHTFSNKSAKVCSMWCEQHLVFTHSFTWGFVLCCVLSHLLGKRFSHWAASHHLKPEAVDSCHANGEVKTEPCTETSSCFPDHGPHLRSDKYLTRRSSTVDPLSLHSASGETGCKIGTETGIPKASRGRINIIKRKQSGPCTFARKKNKRQTSNNTEIKVPSHSTFVYRKHVKQRETVKQGKSMSQSSRFVCTCGKTLSSEHSYIRHRQLCHSHSERMEDSDLKQDKTPFCQVCVRVFQSKWHLNYHRRRKHSGEGSVECDICGKMLSGKFDLKEHNRKTHSTSYLCHTCGRSFFSSNALAGHLATHTGVKSYFCEECGAGFVRKTSLSNHQALHVKVSAFLCDVCSQSFKTRTRLYDHMMNVHHSGPYFDNRVRRLRTMGITVDKEVISRLASGLCTVCAEKLVGGKCLTHCGVNQDVFKCTLCGKAESDIVSLYCHAKWHKEKDTCSAVTPDSFPSHGLLNYECKTCFKKFKNKNYLIKHMQQHRDKRFSCDVCGKSFTYKCNLKSHMTTHSQTRPFECEVCHKAFKLKYTLDVHKKNHCREVDAYKCEICGKGLIRKESLDKHYQTAHP